MEDHSVQGCISCFINIPNASFGGLIEFSGLIENLKSKYSNFLCPHLKEVLSFTLVHLYVFPYLRLYVHLLSSFVNDLSAYVCGTDLIFGQKHYQGELYYTSSFRPVFFLIAGIGTSMSYEHIFSFFSLYSY